MKKYGAIEFERKYKVSYIKTDNVFGKYPFMLFGHNFITRENILPFLCEVYDLNAKLTKEEKIKSSYAIHLCIDVLHHATVPFIFLTIELLPILCNRCTGKEYLEKVDKAYKGYRIP